MLKGLFGRYLNPVAHDTRTLRTVSDAGLLELLTLVPMAHRRLDEAVGAQDHPLGDGVSAAFGPAGSRG